MLQLVSAQTPQVGAGNLLLRIGTFVNEPKKAVFVVTPYMFPPGTPGNFQIRFARTCGCPSKSPCAKVTIVENTIVNVEEVSQ
jgi:hypothetical protein